MTEKKGERLAACLSAFVPVQLNGSSHTSYVECQKVCFWQKNTFCNMLQGSEKIKLKFKKCYFGTFTITCNPLRGTCDTAHQADLVPHWMISVACPVRTHQHKQTWTGDNQHPLGGFATLWQAEEEICRDALEKDLGMKRRQNYRSNLYDFLSWLWQPPSTNTTCNHVNHTADLTVISFKIIISSFKKVRDEQK